LEDHKKKRDANVEAKDVCVEVKDVAFSWGFKIKEDQESNRNPKLRARVLVEDVSEAIIQNVNFSLKPGDLMVVVG
jgi:hypothetical protein